MKIASQEKLTVWVAWTLALVLNALFSGLAIKIFLGNWHHSPQHKPGDFGVLIFVPLGLALLVWAIRETIVWTKFGKTFFVSEATIFPWGGPLEGNISFFRPAPASMGRQFRLRLSCIAQGDRTTYTLWQDSHPVDLAADGTLPVLFSLPLKIESPRVFILTPSISWRLKVKEVGGGFQSFAAEYILPVRPP